jgi:hypothetical protein
MCFGTQVVKSSQENSDTEETKEITEDMGEAPKRVYLSRIVSSNRTTFIPMLCDSGASRSVIGKGTAASRILSSHAVAFDSNTEGWVH